MVSIKRHRTLQQQKRRRKLTRVHTKCVGVCEFCPIQKSTKKSGLKKTNEGKARESERLGTWGFLRRLGWFAKMASYFDSQRASHADDLTDC